MDHHMTNRHMRGKGWDCTCDHLWSKWGHVIRKRKFRCYIHPSFRWIVHLSQDLIVDDNDSGVRSRFGLQLQCCIPGSVYDNGQYSSCCKGQVHLSVIRAIHETINVYVTGVLWADKAASSSDTCAVLVRLCAVLWEMSEGLTELAEVLLCSVMPS